MEYRLDTIGRSIPSNERPDDVDITIHPSKMDVQLLQFINLHGAANTNFLFAYSTHKNIDSVQKAIRRLWKGGYVFRPRVQKTAHNSHTITNVYELDKRGEYYLKDRSLYVDPPPRSNFWLHDYMCHCATASIHIAAEEAGYEYISRHALLARAETTLGTEVDGRDLHPDDMFALKAPDGTSRVYLVEADRGTEQKGLSPTKRKTYEGTVRQYQSFIGSKHANRHYGFTDKMRVFNLTVFNKTSAEEAYLRKIEEVTGECSYMLTRTVNGFLDDWQPPKEIWSGLFLEGWNRALEQYGEMRPFYLDR